VRSSQHLRLAVRINGLCVMQFVCLVYDMESVLSVGSQPYPSPFSLHELGGPIFVGAKQLNTHGRYVAWMDWNIWVLL